MEVARNRPSARWLVVALVALLGLAVIAAGSAPASASSQAVAAKKKCKKKRSASSSKKKKCKKKKIVLPAPAPLVRGKLDWSGGTSASEVDLHAFDASGNHTGWVNPSGVVNGIPNAIHSGDVGGASGTETFTDNIFVVGGPANREFSYVACVYSPEPTSVTFTGVASNGQASSVTVGGGQTALTVQGGPAIPSGFICP
jgi:hypothetical protein